MKFDARTLKLDLNTVKFVFRYAFDPTRTFDEDVRRVMANCINEKIMQILGTANSRNRVVVHFKAGEQCVSYHLGAG